MSVTMGNEKYNFLIDKIDKLEQENKEIAEALEFYANRENWQDLNERTEPNNSSSIIDDSDEFGVDKWNDQYLFGGKRARQALEKNKEMIKGE